MKLQRYRHKNQSLFLLLMILVTSYLLLTMSGDQVLIMLLIPFLGLLLTSLVIGRLVDNKISIEVDTSSLYFEGEGKRYQLLLSSISEVFYVNILDQTPNTTYEKPSQLQVVVRDRRLSLDLEHFDQEDVIAFNLKLQEILDGKFTEEQKYTRKVLDTDKIVMESNREFIQLDTLN